MFIDADLLEERCPLDNGRHENQNGSAETGSSSNLNIGSLQCLPPEIIDLIFDHLDLQSLTDIRRVSWHARALIDRLPSYSFIARHAPEAIRAMLATQMAAHFTAPDILDAICQEVCSACGHFGPLLRLFCCRRFCRACMLSSYELLPMSVAAAKMEFGLNDRSLKLLPILFTVPGIYTDDDRRYQRRLELISRKAAVEVGIQQYGSLEAVPKRRKPMSILQVVSEQQNNQPYIYMSSIRVPTVNRHTGFADTGVACLGCKNSIRYPKARGLRPRDTLFTAPGFVQHYRNCELAQKLPRPNARADALWNLAQIKASRDEDAY